MRLKIIIYILILCPTVSLFGSNDTLYLNVKKYGAIGDGIKDDGKALRKVVSIANKTKKPVKIIFEPGKSYYVDAYLDNFGGLFFNRKSHLVVEGNGSLLKLHPTNRAFHFYRCNNVLVQNLEVDYYPLPYTQGRITRIENKKGYLEFEIDAGFPKPLVAGDEYYNDGKISDCATMNGKDLKFYPGHSKVTKVIDLGNNIFRVQYKMLRQDKAAVGDYFAMKIGYATEDMIKNTADFPLHEKGEIINTGSGSFYVKECNGISFINITSYASPVMTFNLTGCTDQLFRNVKVIRRKGRVIAGNSDGIHLKCNASQPIIEMSWLEGTLDDNIHIKISGDIISEVESARRVKIRHADVVSDNTNLKVGSTVMVFDTKTGKQKAICEITAYEPTHCRSGWVTLSKDVKDIAESDHLYLMAKGEALIQNCRFETQLQRCILTHQPTIIRNCLMRDTGKGVHISLGSNNIEGPPNQRCEIENCDFINLQNEAITNICPSKNYDQGGTPQLIIRNCRFDLPENVLALRSSNSQGIEMTGNRFSYVASEPDKEKCFNLQNTEFTLFQHNVFKKGWSDPDLNRNGVPDVVEKL